MLTLYIQINIIIVLQKKIFRITVVINACLCVHILPMVCNVTLEPLSATRPAIFPWRPVYITTREIVSPEHAFPLGKLLQCINSPLFLLSVLYCTVHVL